jgi:hypothetical protein
VSTILSTFVTKCMCFYRFYHIISARHLYLFIHFIVRFLCFRNAPIISPTKTREISRDINKLNCHDKFNTDMSSLLYSQIFMWGKGTPRTYAAVFLAQENQISAPYFSPNRTRHIFVYAFFDLFLKNIFFTLY